MIFLPSYLPTSKGAEGFPHSVSKLSSSTISNPSSSVRPVPPITANNFSAIPYSLIPANGSPAFNLLHHTWRPLYKPSGGHHNPVGVKQLLHPLSLVDRFLHYSTKPADWRRSRCCFHSRLVCSDSQSKALWPCMRCKRGLLARGCSFNQSSTSKAPTLLLHTNTMSHPAARAAFARSA